MMQIRQYMLLVLQKSTSDLISEARQGYIGILWWIVEPVLYLSVFYFIFVVVFNRGGKEAVAFLLIGLVVWKWFGSSIPKCSNSISANIGLIRQIYIPKMLFPCMTVVTTAFKFFIVFILLISFLLVIGFDVNVAWAALPLLVVVQFILILSIGSILAAVVPFLPDLKFVIENAMMLLFFLSGIFFDFSAASPEIRAVLQLNPMLGLIDSYRLVLISGTWPDWGHLSVIFITSLVGLFAGWYILGRYDRVYPKIV